MTALAALLQYAIYQTQQRTLDFTTTRECTVNTTTAPDIAAIAIALAAPFAETEIRWKPASITKDGKRALAIAYVDARTVIDRLDEVFHLDGWEDAYECQPDGSGVCTLTVKVDKYISKMDVGAPSDQPDEGDRKKAAFSDALKRAAVKFGIGRYLYRLKSQWVDWDQQKRQFVKTPTLPPWALPATEKLTSFNLTARGATKPTNGRPTKNGNAMPLLYDGQKAGEA